jgi:hypothetical protein
VSGWVNVVSHDERDSALASNAVMGGVSLGRLVAGVRGEDGGGTDRVCFPARQAECDVCPPTYPLSHQHRS